MDTELVRPSAITGITVSILTPALLTATTDLTGSWAELSLEPGPGTTATGDADSTDAVDGATVAVSMGATTMADENTTLGDAAIPAAATVADMPTARSGVVTPAVVSVEVSTAVAVGSADNGCSDNGCSDSSREITPAVANAASRF